MNTPFGSEDETTNWCIDWLRAKGFAITRPVAPEEQGEKLRIAELRARLGLKSNTVCKRLYHRDCPIYRAEYGPSLRILWIWLTPELHAWLSRPLVPGRRSEISNLPQGPELAEGKSQIP